MKTKSACVNPWTWHGFVMLRTMKIYPRRVFKEGFTHVQLYCFLGLRSNFRISITHLRHLSSSTNISFHKKEFRFDNITTSPDRHVMANPKGRKESPAILCGPTRSRSKSPFKRHGVGQFANLRSLLRCDVEFRASLV